MNGVTFYKKFNNNTLGGKIFDPLNSKENPPEACGFALRNFKINPVEEIIEVRNPKNRHIELKINLSLLKGVIISNTTKNLIKNKKSTSTRPNQEVNKLMANTDYIPFILTHTDGKIDLISQNYQGFYIFESALEQILKNKKNLSSILKNFEV